MACHRPRSFVLLFVLVVLCPFLVFAIADQSSMDQSSHSNIGFVSLASETDNPSLKPHTLPPNVTSHLCLNYEDPESAHLTRALLHNVEADDPPYLRESIKSIKVDGFGSLANFTAISSALRLIKELHELDWQNQAPVPGVILDTLSAYHPDCKLHYDMHFSNWDMYADDYVPIQGVGDEPHRDIRAQTRRLIVGSTNLHSLKAHIGYGSQPDSESLTLVHDILTGCPKLRELDLRISRCGCVVTWPQPYSFDFTTSTASFAPLEVLRLSGYRLDDPYEGHALRHERGYPQEDELRWPWNSLPTWMVHRLWDWVGFEPLLYDIIRKPWIPKPDKCPSGSYCEHDSTATTNLDGCLERMDFSKLQTVDLGSMSVVSLLKLQNAGVLTSVSNLHIHGGNKCLADLLPDFIDALRQPLSTLCLGNIDFPDLDRALPAIAKHGQSLTSLHLTEHQECHRHWCHQNEPGTESSLQCRAFGRGTWHDPHLYFNTSSLLSLSSSCTNITNLDIDLNRNATSLASDLSAIGSFPNLSGLTLRVESPTFQRTRAGIRPSDPHSDADILFDPLFSRKSVLIMFQKIRQTQVELAVQASDSLLSSYHVIHPPPPTPSPALQEMTVYIGDFASRHSHGMSMSERYVLGRFHCTLTSAGEELCTGGITFPSDTIYHDLYAYGGSISRSSLDKDGLWDPSMETMAATYRRRLRAAEEGVEEIKRTIGLKKQYPDWQGSMEGLREVLGLVEQELEDLKAEVVRNVADGDALLSGTEEAFRHRRGQDQEDEEEAADVLDLQRQMGV